MEIESWKRDETPYLVFKCGKCGQYSYVKTTQKTKKCLRCGRTYKVASIRKSGEIVKGLTEAMKSVKAKQNELAIDELGSSPNLRTEKDFVLSSKSHSGYKKEILKEPNKEYAERFKKILDELSKSHKKFPYFMLEIMTEERQIPMSELKALIRKFVGNGYLIPLENNYYKVSVNS